ncbi:hypothetical protein [uncultured Methylibium sp.]|uniref:hypothetical protein n=1 Tax=uncultured Methylibium sp. TaxID=381093 RepID=UPI0025CFBF50|nr:hypothetical protein [uncultured Methylibium sp.]
MPLPNLDRLVTTGMLHAEPPAAEEFAGLLRSGLARLTDAGHAALAPESRFDLAYNAAHALCLAAMRWHGYRPANKRYLVFQVLPDTLGLGPEVWRVLAKAHELRNRSEYEGAQNIDQRLVTDLIGACRLVAQEVRSLPPPAP